MKINRGKGARDTKEVISFRKVIPPNTVNEFMQERVKAPGTVEGVYVRFYPGQQKSLQIIPMVEHKGRMPESLITYASSGETYLSGDDDRLDIPVVVSVDTNDYIKVQYSNVDPTYSYTLVVDVVVDYYAGQDRVIGGVL